MHKDDRCLSNSHDCVRGPKARTMFGYAVWVILGNNCYIKIVLICVHYLGSILKKRSFYKLNFLYQGGLWFGSVGRAVAGNIRGPQFESSNQEKYMMNISTVNY